MANYKKIWIEYVDHAGTFSADDELVLSYAVGGPIGPAGSGGAVVNNPTVNELVTVASNTSELDAESDLTFDGTTLYLGQTFQTSVKDHGDLTSNAELVINFNDAPLQKINLGANITKLSTSHRGEGKSLTLKLATDGIPRGIAFDPLIRFVGSIPTVIPANKIAVLTLTSFGVNEYDTIAGIAIEDGGDSTPIIS